LDSLTQWNDQTRMKPKASFNKPSEVPNQSQKTPFVNTWFHWDGRYEMDNEKNPYSRNQKPSKP